MIDYDFQILQHNEFECLSRDLIQKKEKVFVESFTIGRDDGIDLRFAKVKNSRTIVQAKRYKSLSTLMSELKKEVKKVSELSIDRYILCTSLGLTPKNKDEIKALFEPYIISTEDIIGRDDLNNLLGQYPEVERKYYKLWLGSTNVLESITNNRINNWSEFHLERIRNDIHKYVMNESFNKACDILKEHRYVIISGIPGIGKSTLANMLVYKFLADGYDEFVYITGNIDDASQKYQKGRKQIFLFDDFLGSNIFEKGENGFDKKLISFIESVSRSKNTLFILTTREYILSQAKDEYEKLNIANIDIRKCTLDFQFYTMGIRAKILYNHLASTEIPKEYLREIISDRRYNSIINHKNFNPRIIETIINQRLWEQVAETDFYNKVMEMFNNPISVWEYPFKRLDNFTKQCLLVLRTLSRRVLMDDWKEAFKAYITRNSSQLGFVYDEDNWHRAIKILSDCFITTTMQYGEITVQFHNPSVPEFLEGYLRKRIDVQRMLLKGAIFEEQIYTVFNDSHLSGLEDKEIIEACDQCMADHKRCYVTPGYFGDKIFKARPNKLSFLKELATKHTKRFRNTGYIEKHLSLEDLKEVDNFHIIYSLVSNIDQVQAGIKVEDIIECMLEGYIGVDNYDRLLSYIECHSSIDQYKEDILDNILDDVKWELEYTREVERCDEISDLIDSIGQSYFREGDLQRIYDAIMSKRDDLENEEDNEEEDYTGNLHSNDYLTDLELEEMFTSLLAY